MNANQWIIALRTSLEIQREALIQKKVAIDSRILVKKIYINSRDKQSQRKQPRVQDW